MRTQVTKQCPTSSGNDSYFSSSFKNTLRQTDRALQNDYFYFLTLYNAVKLEARWSIKTQTHNIRTRAHNLKLSRLNTNLLGHNFVTILWQYAVTLLYVKLADFCHIAKAIRLVKILLLTHSQRILLVQSQISGTLSKNTFQ